MNYLNSYPNRHAVLYLLHLQLRAKGVFLVGLHLCLGCTCIDLLAHREPYKFNSSVSLFEERLSSSISAPVRGSMPSVTSLFAEQAELDLGQLIKAVLDRNPSLAEMHAAWQAASARYLQVTSLDDPMLRVSVGPGSFGTDSVNPAYRFELSQSIPFPGKLSLRGEQADREASASAYDYLDTKLALIEATKSAYYDYYLIHRALEVNQENLKLLEEAQRTAVARVRTGVAPQQDLVQIQVELGRLQERRITLQRVLTLSKARINALLHLPPESPLPPPVRRLNLYNELPEISELEELARSYRPDLLALRQRLEADRLGLDLAYREFYPDFELMAAYDAFWQEIPLRTMIGIGVNLPVQITRRRGAVAENLARLAQRQAQFDRLMDQILFQIQDAYARLQENRQIVQLYEKKLLPAAETNVREAIAAYTAGRIPLLSLIESQRNLVELRGRYYEALAEYHRSLAALERAVGRPLSFAYPDKPDK